MYARWNWAQHTSVGIPASDVYLVASYRTDAVLWLKIRLLALLYYCYWTLVINLPVKYESEVTVLSVLKGSEHFACMCMFKILQFEVIWFLVMTASWNNSHNSITFDLYEVTVHSKYEPFHFDWLPSVCPCLSCIFGQITIRQKPVKIGIMLHLRSSIRPSRSRVMMKQ